MALLNFKVSVYVNNNNVTVSIRLIDNIITYLFVSPIIEALLWLMILCFRNSAAEAVQLLRIGVSIN